LAKEDNNSIEPLDVEIRRKVDVGKDDLLELLAGLLTRDLVIRIAMGIASPADRNVARQILRDAGYELTDKNKNVANLKDVLGKMPFEVNEDDGDNEPFRLPGRASGIA
jgi:hypothetical protein